jgi:hypothetical protein
MRHTVELRHAAKGGAIAGIVAGLLSSVPALVSSALEGNDLWSRPGAARRGDPVRMIRLPLY